MSFASKRGITADPSEYTCDSGWVKEMPRALHKSHLKTLLMRLCRRM
jgi:hypothetical protein